MLCVYLKSPITAKCVYFKVNECNQLLQEGQREGAMGHRERGEGTDPGGVYLIMSLTQLGTQGYSYFLGPQREVGVISDPWGGQGDLRRKGNVPDLGGSR